MMGMAVDHPYYCNESNYYSNDASMKWETMTEFLDAMEDSDVDMNLVFRWDVRPRGETGAEYGRFCAEVFIMHQRKGKFAPHDIKHVSEAEIPRFKAYVEKHWRTMQKIWSPVSGVKLEDES
tara:strand:+ start:354 stop:719 length:366 start_codon:yes stop_codon:yes gene_type:complete